MRFLICSKPPPPSTILRLLSIVQRTKWLWLLCSLRRRRPVLRYWTVFEFHTEPSVLTVALEDLFKGDFFCIYWSSLSSEDQQRVKGFYILRWSRGTPTLSKSLVAKYKFKGDLPCLVEGTPLKRHARELSKLISIIRGTQ